MFADLTINVKTTIPSAVESSFFVVVAAEKLHRPMPNF
jgi:hypothetical protein